MVRSIIAQKVKAASKNNSKAKPKATAKAKKVAKPKRAVKKAAAASKKVASPPKKATRPKAAPKKAKGPHGYTSAEYTTFKDHIKTFQNWSNQQLKDLLRSNLQSMSGNKDDLVYKCADGATLGQIPRCPKCFGGRPKWDYVKGVYHCSGYRDDTDFHNCHTNFAKNEITRSPWQSKV